MGGSSSGSISSADLMDLERKAKNKLLEANNSGNKHVFISFSSDDLDEVNLLRGQAKNANNELDFDDYSIKEPINSDKAEYIKSKIREKLRLCSKTLVYLTNNSAKSDWVNWEIRESIKMGNTVIGVYKGQAPPSKLPTSFDRKNKIVKWSHTELAQAIKE